MKSMDSISNSQVEYANIHYTKEVCSEFASDIANKKKTFLNLVETLESLLTNTDLNKHIAGLNVLANVVELLPKNLLPPTEIKFIAHYFCSQVKLHHSFISTSLNGLLPLVQCPHISKDELHHITSTLFNNVVWQSQTLSDRRTFYYILQNIVFDRIEDYKTVSSEFLFNIISSVDGERDPRNLLVLFSLFPRLYTSLPFGLLVEDAFEAVSCYFPIDFYPTPSDPGVVTREDLVFALTPCLLATPEFCEFVIPLICEKLESKLKSAKIDSYNLLMRACELWPGELFAVHCEPLWLLIREDTLPPRDSQVAEAATRALQAVARVLPESALAPLLTTVFHSCEGFLSDVDLSLFDPAFNILLALIRDSVFACNLVTLKLLPKLLPLLRVTRESSRVTLLNKLSSLIQVCHNNNYDFDSEAAHWEPLQMEMCSCVAQRDKAVQHAAYCVLTQLASRLSLACRSQLYKTLLNDLVTLQPGPVRSACLKCLQSLAQVFSNEVKTLIVDELLSNQGSEELSVWRNKLEALCWIAGARVGGSGNQFHQVLDLQLSSLLTKGEAFVSVTISCLRNILEEEEIQNNKALLDFLFSQSSLLKTLINLETNDQDLVNSATIIKILVQPQNPSEQVKVVKPLVTWLLENTSGTKQLVLLEGAICALWPDVSAVVLSAEDVRKVIILAALQAPSLHQACSLRLMATLINKAKNDCLLELARDQLQQFPVHQTVTAHAYITKALVLRGHPLMDHWVDKLLDLLDLETVGEAAADGVHLLVDDRAVDLSSQHHCLTRLLYRQRLFTKMVPRLTQHPRPSPHHLHALASLLGAVPHTVLAPYIKQIVPLVVRSLDSESESLLRSILQTLSHQLTSDCSSLQDYADTLIKHFLRLSQHNPAMHVRMAALQCLANSLKFPAMLILPCKQEVLAQLIPCLDDKKRLVRKEAARTRSKWFLLGAPTVNGDSV